jgi:hypothetical protein
LGVGAVGGKLGVGDFDDRRWCGETGFTSEFAFFVRGGTALFAVHIESPFLVQK